MGIKGIYNEIGPGERIALSKFAVEIYEKHSRPLRLAIDISIWLFQIQSGKGGTNPALRTFYYRLLRLHSLAIHPLFVFDGPNKPPFKRNKRTGPSVASIPEFLAKQILKQFGIPFHLAPGEAEAECALLQARGIVDAVLSEDVDTLMFGSGLTLRNWSPEGTSSTKIPTHVNLYDARKTKSGKSGLDREGMILVALMSGGDYIPEGIPGCGPKTACEAARAGFGVDLCRLSRKDLPGLALWKERLAHELRTNESKFFRQKHKSLVIPEDFPRPDVMAYYTHPCVSADEKLIKLQRSMRWDQPIDIPGLRTFVGEAFSWTCLSGAHKFIRTLAPVLLVKELRLLGQDNAVGSDDTYEIAMREAQLVKSIHSKRNHITTDGATELRVGFIPLDLVQLDLDAEEADSEHFVDDSESADEALIMPSSQAVSAAGGSDLDISQSPKKKRTSSTYNPAHLQKIWILETFVKVGAPLKVQDWEESFRNAKKYEQMKAANQRIANSTKSKKAANGGMPKGALDRFTRISKPGVRHSNAKVDHKTSEEKTGTVVPVTNLKQPAASPIASVRNPLEAVCHDVDPYLPTLLVTERDGAAGDSHLPLSSIQPRRREFRRSHSDSSGLIGARREPAVLAISAELSLAVTIPSTDNDTSIIHPQAADWTTRKDVTKRRLPHSRNKSSNEAEQRTDFEASKGKIARAEFQPIPELPPSVTKRKQRSHFRRCRSIPITGMDDSPQSLTPPPKRLNTFQDTDEFCLGHSDSNTFHLSTVDRFNLVHLQPLTPRKSLKAQNGTMNSQEIILINSSPVTPKVKQKLITSWLSPTQAASKASFDMNDSSRQHPGIDEIAPYNGSDDITAMVHPRLSLSRGSACAHITLQEQNDYLHRPAQMHNTATSEKKLIQQRQDLKAGWNIVATESCASSETRSTQQGHGREGKVWRTSRVEVLDLTST